MSTPNDMKINRLYQVDINDVNKNTNTNTNNKIIEDLNNQIIEFNKKEEITMSQLFLLTDANKKLAESNDDLKLHLEKVNNKLNDLINVNKCKSSKIDQNYKIFYLQSALFILLLIVLWFLFNRKD